MRPIPPEMKAKMDADPFYHRCAIHNWQCEGVTQWHHCWIYASKQISEPWAIMPACHKHHEMVQTDPWTKRLFERLSIARATPDDLAKYPRKDWAQLKIALYAKMI